MRRQVVRDDFARKQIHDSAKIIVSAAGFHVSEVAYPNLIGQRRIEILRKMIDANALGFSRFCGFERLFGAHLGQIHGFQQTVHSSVADVDAIFSEKTKLELVYAEPLVRTGVKLDDPLLNLAIKKLTFRRFMIQKLVIRASVHPQNSAKRRDFVLAGQRFNGVQSLSECGVKIAMAFFSMRFSSSSWAFLFCRALICSAVMTVLSSILTSE